LTSRTSELDDADDARVGELAGGLDDPERPREAVGPHLDGLAAAGDLGRPLILDLEAAGQADPLVHFGARREVIDAERATRLNVVRQLPRRKTTPGRRRSAAEAELVEPAPRGRNAPITETASVAQQTRRRRAATESRALPMSASGLGEHRASARRAADRFKEPTVTTTRQTRSPTRRCWPSSATPPPPPWAWKRSARRS
jgi:hypothetical protein